MAGRHTKQGEGINIRELVGEASKEIAAEDSGVRDRPRVSTAQDPLGPLTKGSVLARATKPAPKPAKK